MFVVRVAVSSALAVSLAACTVITSFRGLEAAGGNDAGDGRQLPDSDAYRDDSSALDSTPDDSAGYGDVTPDGEAALVDVIGDALQEADTSADGGASRDGTSSHAEASQGDAGEREAAIRGDGSGSSGDAAGDGAVLGEAGSSDSEVVGDANVGYATVDAVASVDATLSCDSAKPSEDANDTCTPDANSDPNNCGSCGHSCLGGTCTDGQCGPVTLAVTHGSIGLASDATYLYWADTTAASDAGAINKVSKALTGLGAPSIVASGTVAQSVGGIVTDGTHVYWTNKGAGQVYRALSAGGGLTTLATGQSTPDWIASNGTIIAWTDEGSNRVMSLPINSDGGGAPTQLNVLNELGTKPSGIAIDPGDVYYVTKNAGGGLAEVVPVDGGAVTEFGEGTYVGIAMDANNVYWTGGSGNPVVYQNSKSGTPASIIAIATGTLICPLAIASDGANVYFLDQGSTTCAPPGTTAGALYRVPVGNTGPLPAPLVTGLFDPQGLVVDATAIYWVTGGTPGAVMKIAK